MMTQQRLDLIGANIGWGAKLHETQWGPKMLKEAGFLTNAQHQSFLKWRSQLTSSTDYVVGMQLSYAQKLAEISSFNQNLAKEVISSLKEDKLPIVIGGDHSIAIGTWSGVVSYFNAPKQFGLIWLDAHMDSHIPQTSPSHAIHGMPLAVLLGHGESSLVNLYTHGPKLDPSHVVLIGVRSFEDEEEALLKKLNVKVYKMFEVIEVGFAKVFAQAIEQVSLNTKGFGVSIDLDAFDPLKVPGVGSPVAQGLIPEEVYEPLRKLKDNPKFKALEVAEFNPTKDVNQQTATVIKRMILSLLQNASE